MASPTPGITHISPISSSIESSTTKTSSLDKSGKGDQVVLPSSNLLDATTHTGRNYSWCQDLHYDYGPGMLVGSHAPKHFSAQCVESHPTRPSAPGDTTNIGPALPSMQDTTLPTEADGVPHCDYCPVKPVSLHATDQFATTAITRPYARASASYLWPPYYAAPMPRSTVTSEPTSPTAQDTTHYVDSLAGDGPDLTVHLGPASSGSHHGTCDMKHADIRLPYERHAC